MAGGLQLAESEPNEGGDTDAVVGSMLPLQSLPSKVNDSLASAECVSEEHESDASDEGDNRLLAADELELGELADGGEVSVCAQRR